MSASNPSRRAFLRGHIRPEAVIRPPWSPDEAAFTRACDRCGDCVRVCPAGILRPGSGGYPETRFDQAGCSLCGDCLTACAGKVLKGDPLVDRPWALEAVIAQGCLAETGVICRGCGDVCDTRAIRFTPRIAAPALPRLDPELCNGCGECVSRCPTGAIRIAVRQSESAGETSADGLDRPTCPQTVVSAHEHL